MKVRLVRLAALCCLLSAPWLGARAVDDEFTARSAVGVPEEVLVVGEQPGPGLWRVSKGSHSLWILGTYAPTPRGMVWRSRQVESVIASANEVLGPYSATLRVKGAQAYQAKGQTLGKVLPRRVYERWRSLRDKYIGKEPETETLLPTAAALLLQARAYERNGLAYTDDIWRTIYKLANTSVVPVWRQDYEMGPVTPGKNSSRLSRENGIKYLVETMDRLESDIAQSRTRANAWAVGDVEALKALVESDASYAQSLAYSWPFLSQDEVHQLQSGAENKLLSAIERALNRNETTFAALPVHLIARRDGVVARLRAAGYSVEEPQ
jgi:uncharacterized protein YbaP (TraB family)